MAGGVTEIHDPAVPAGLLSLERRLQARSLGGWIQRPAMPLHRRCLCVEAFDRAVRSIDDLAEICPRTAA